MESIEKQLNLPKSPVNNAVFSMANAAFYNSAVGVGKDVRKVCGVRPPSSIVPKFLQTKQMKENLQRWNDCVNNAQANVLSAQSQSLIDSQFMPSPTASSTPEQPTAQEGLSTTAKIAIGVTALALIGTASYFLFLKK